MRMPVPRSRESPLRFCSRWVGLAGAVATALLVWASQSYGQEYSAQNWHTEDGLPDEEITAIEQTPDGYLWVGTPKGLARFDGQRFRLFKTESSPELRDARISNLLTDREGTLWIGTLDGNLVLRKGNRFEPVQPPVPLPLDRDKKRPPRLLALGLTPRADRRRRGKHLVAGDRQGDSPPKSWELDSLHSYEWSPDRDHSTIGLRRQRARVDCGQRKASLFLRRQMESDPVRPPAERSGRRAGTCGQGRAVGG